MDEKGVIKTILSFGIDIWVFIIIAFIVAAVIGGALSTGLGSLGTGIGLLIGLIMFITMMWGNYKYRYSGE